MSIMHRLELNMFKIQHNNNSSISTTQNKVRFNDISILRVSAMLLVVFYHCLCPYSIWDGGEYFIGFHVRSWDIIDGMLAQIHLPIFFLISGYLYGYKRNLGGYSDNVKFVNDKVNRVLIPYVIVGLFLCFLQDREISQMLNGISHLWFLLTIFECYILGKALSSVLWIKEKNRLLVMALLMLLVILASYKIPKVQFLCLSNLITYYSYYMIGMMACKINFGSLTKYKNQILLIGALLVVLFAMQQVYFNRKLVTVALGSAIVFLMFTFARSLNIQKLPFWVVSLDKCSMGIYIVHHIVIQEINGIGIFHDYACLYYYIYPLLQFMVVTALSWLFVAICKRYKYSKYILG